MNYNRKNIGSKILNWSIALPIGTLAFVGLMFFLSSAYKPNWSFNWEGIRPEIRDTVKLIEEYGSVTSGAVGINAKTPQQWHRRKWLISNANESELLMLIEYPNGAVKATAFEALLRKSNMDKFKLMNQALEDTTTFFNYQSGCVGFPMMLGEYLTEIVVGFSDVVPPPRPDLTKKLDCSEEETNNLIKMYHELKDKKEAYFRRKYE